MIARSIAFQLRIRSGLSWTNYQLFGRSHPTHMCKHECLRSLLHSSTPIETWPARIPHHDIIVRLFAEGSQAWQIVYPWCSSSRSDLWMVSLRLLPCCYLTNARCRSKNRRGITLHKEHIFSMLFGIHNALAGLNSVTVRAEGRHASEQNWTFNLHSTNLCSTSRVTNANQSYIANHVIRFVLMIMIIIVIKALSIKWEMIAR